MTQLTFYVAQFNEKQGQKATNWKWNVRMTGNRNRSGCEQSLDFDRPVQMIFFRDNLY
jgi:hypothetical protein